MNTALNVEKLYSLINEKGLIQAIASEFGSSVKVKIFFPNSVCSQPIENLDFSVRGYNCLKRNNIHCVEDLISKIENGDIKDFRNLGKKTVSEIKTKLLNFVYHSLSKERQMEFLSALIKDNAK